MAGRGCHCFHCETDGCELLTVANRTFAAQNKAARIARARTIPPAAKFRWMPQEHLCSQFSGLVRHGDG